MKKSLAAGITTVIVLLTGCGSPRRVSLPTDVGSDFDYKYVYYLEDDVLVRGYCADDVIVINRANCQVKERILAWAFFESSEKMYLDQIATSEHQVNQLVIQVNDLDGKILMMLQDAPGYDQSRLPQIRHFEALLTDVEARISGIRDQIARIESQLARNEDPDLRVLLQDQQRKLEAALKEQGQVRTALYDLRRLHLDANNGIVNVDTYRRLVGQREQAVNQLSFAEGGLAFDISRFGGYLAAIKFLRDQEVWTFTSRDPMDDMVARAVDQFTYIFNILHFSQLFAKWEDGAATYLVALPGAKMFDVDYSNNNTGGNCSGVKITHKNFTLTHNENHLYVDRDNIGRYPHLAPLFSQEVSGRLKFTPICNGPFRENDVSGVIVVTKEQSLN